VYALAVITDENTLLHMSMSMIPRHLFGSLRSLFFGTGILWLLCHPSWSTFSSKNSQTWRWTILRGELYIDLRASGGIPLRPGDFPFLSLLMSFLTLLNVMGLSIEVMYGFCSRRLRTE